MRAGVVGNVRAVNIIVIDARASRHAPLTGPRQPRRMIMMRMRQAAPSSHRGDYNTNIVIYKKSVTMKARSNVGRTYGQIRQPAAVTARHNDVLSYKCVASVLLGHCATVHAGNTSSDSVSTLSTSTTVLVKGYTRT